MAGRTRPSQQAEDLDRDLRTTVADLTEFDVRPVEPETTKGFVVLFAHHLMERYRNTPLLAAALLLVVVLLVALLAAGILALGSDDAASAAGGSSVAPTAVPAVPSSTSAPDRSATSSTSAAPTTTAVPVTTAVPATAAPTTTVLSTIRLPIGLAWNSDVIDVHQGQMIWNQTADNVLRDDVTWWLARVFGRSEAPSGWIGIDLASETVSGVVAEEWKCVNDCEDARLGAMDTGWKATIRNGVIEPDGDGWVLSGEVDIDYRLVLDYREGQTNDCSGSCSFAGTGSATVPLRGFIRGDQVEVRFNDGITGMLADMDFSGLEETSFWMSRFVQVWTVDLS